MEMFTEVNIEVVLYPHRVARSQLVDNDTITHSWSITHTAFQVSPLPRSKQ